MKLIYLLNRYGAKFSSYKRLYYNFEASNKVTNTLSSDGLKPQMYLSLILKKPSLILNEFQSFKQEILPNLQLRLSSTAQIPLIVYLKSILHLLKLNLPTMFINTTRFPEAASKDIFGQQLKRDLAANFHNLILFIKNDKVQSPLEKQVYFDHIQLALESLSNV